MGTVGPIVEPPDESAPDLSASTPPDDGRGYDFAVNDLLFHVASSDDRPYQRATAQFRKDQYDTAQTSGDQSLTGWWTRGEFSFHKGAGITYYEVSEGDTIANRFNDGDALYPWRPGKVTCETPWSENDASVSAVRFVFPFLSTGIALLDGTTTKYGTNPDSLSTLTPTGGGTTRALAVSPRRGYVLTTAGKISSFDSLPTQVGLYSGLTTTSLGLWYVKGRLIVADSDGKWYQLSTAPASPPVAVSGADVIFTAGEDWELTSVVCDTPGPILIGNSNRIFALTVDATTGSIPSLSTPVQIAELPPLETVFGMVAHLGFIVLVTSAGVRVAVLSDTGQLTYGPLLVERETPTSGFLRTSLGRVGTRVLVVVDNRIIDIDLSQQIGSGLEFGWIGRGTPFPDTATAAGIVVLNNGTQTAWSESKTYRSVDTNYMAGWLTTGFHRFGTLENKRFDSVRVTADGTHGSIEISKISASGTVTSMYSLDVSQAHEVDLSFGSTGGEEMLALRFDLIPDPDHVDETPVLLGYQIRALPQPDRQRMIRVPVQVFDKERRQPAQGDGHEGWAWERLQALENLEQTNAVVSFRDYRTGEAGTAFIESVEFSNITPPSGQGTGFGGYGFITLRKL